MFDNGVAFVKLTRYFREKVRVTGSVSSIVVAVPSFSSMPALGLTVTEPLPMSPSQENVTPSLLHSILTDSDNPWRSRVILAKSAEGIDIVQAYSTDVSDV